MSSSKVGKLKGQVIIVTGGASGIGRGICTALVEEGAKVAIVQRRLDQAEQAAASLQGAVGFAADISAMSQVELMTDAVLSAFGQIDGLVNNASVTGEAALGCFATMSADRLNQIVDTNLKGTIWCSQCVARILISAKRPGSIVHISSVGAFAAQEMAVAYCATKAAQVSLAQSMALELAPHHIRVNAVAPGDILTERNAAVGKSLERVGSSGKYLRVTPLGRRGMPIEIGRAVAFLLSSDAAFITGTTLTVDGGFLAY